MQHTYPKLFVFRPEVNLPHILSVLLGTIGFLPCPMKIERAYENLPPFPASVASVVQAKDIAEALVYTS
ncbi:hypothetical protein EUGRSUZ_C00002 [Eucalyptus grandis]|uniref:Uncharacterized protein n=2 Tax=Eucalyptus grandis TaxID=71139 RepID=A0ACC3LA28_EUCGR|nr:hypothetical protein EUGRSUZ_C00002 [Eucalyptus grandis]